jgi:hypothetical protein
VLELAGQVHTEVFVMDGVDARPIRHERCSNRMSVNPLLHTGNEVVFPGTPLKLPGAEGNETRKQQHTQKCEDQVRRAGARGMFGVHRARSLAQKHARQGMFFISCADIGIMLVFKWYITQIEPLSVITTSTMVKISANMDHPPSTLVFMCRK